jgi:hypothetical protein
MGEAVIVGLATIAAVAVAGGLVLPVPFGSSAIMAFPVFGSTWASGLRGDADPTAFRVEDAVGVTLLGGKDEAEPMLATAEALAV